MWRAATTVPPRRDAALRKNARAACAFVRIGACGSLAPSRESDHRRGHLADRRRESFERHAAAIAFASGSARDLRVLWRRGDHQEHWRRRECLATTSAQRHRAMVRGSVAPPPGGLRLADCTAAVPAGRVRGSSRHRLTAAVSSLVNAGVGAGGRRESMLRLSAGRIDPEDTARPSVFQ